MTTFAVVTRVAEPETGGNLRAALGDVWLDPLAKGGQHDDVRQPLGKALGQPMLDLFVQVPVFRVGELLLIDGNDRDQFGRKPSKWDVDVEEFDNIDAAVERVREVASS